MGECIPMKMDSGAVAHICRSGATREIKRESTGESWCFHCRKRQEFFYVVTGDVEPSYYGPNPDIICGQCKTSDGDLFPGREREWE